MSEPVNGVLGFDTFEDVFKMDKGIPTRLPEIKLKEGYHLNYAINRLPAISREDRPVSDKEISQFYPTRADRFYHTRIDPRIEEEIARKGAIQVEESTHGDMIEILHKPQPVQDGSLMNVFMNDKNKQAFVDKIMMDASKMVASGIPKAIVDEYVKKAMLQLDMKQAPAEQQAVQVDDNGQPIENADMQLMANQGGIAPPNVVDMLSQNEQDAYVYRNDEELGADEWNIAGEAPRPVYRNGVAWNIPAPMNRPHRRRNVIAPELGLSNEQQLHGQGELDPNNINNDRMDYKHNLAGNPAMVTGMDEDLTEAENRMYRQRQKEKEEKKLRMPILSKSQKEAREVKYVLRDMVSQVENKDWDDRRDDRKAVKQVLNDMVHDIGIEKDRLDEKMILQQIYKERDADMKVLTDTKVVSSVKASIEETLKKQLKQIPKAEQKEVKEVVKQVEKLLSGKDKFKKALENMRTRGATKKNMQKIVSEIVTKAMNKVDARESARPAVNNIVSNAISLIFDEQKKNNR